MIVLFRDEKKKKKQNRFVVGKKFFLLDFRYIYTSGLISPNKFDVIRKTRDKIINVEKKRREEQEEAELYCSAFVQLCAGLAS